MALDWTTGKLEAGLRCYRAGQFFEAHEHWESVWLLATEPEKTFLQALIQVAGSFHHFQRGNRGGAQSMMRKALLRLDRYPEAFGGVALAPLRTELHRWLEALETVSEGQMATPQIPLTTSQP